MRIGIIIPAYNEEETISNLAKSLLSLSLDGDNAVEEIIVIDDGSTDRTRIEAEKSGARVIVHEQNKGKGEALKTGFQYARSKGFEAVITMDADEQHDWKEIPDFLERAEHGGADIVIGNRMGNVQDMPFVRLWTNRITSWLVSAIAHQKIEDSQSGYRLIKKEALDKVDDLSTSNFDTESEILVKASRRGCRICSVPIKTIYKEKFNSEIRPFKDTLRFIRLIISLKGTDTFSKKEKVSVPFKANL